MLAVMLGNLFYLIAPLHEFCASDLHQLFFFTRRKEADT